MVYLLSTAGKIQGERCVSPTLPFKFSRILHADSNYPHVISFLSTLIDNPMGEGNTLKNTLIIMFLIKILFKAKVPNLNVSIM